MFGLTLFGLEIGFDEPRFLWLLIFIPVLWFLSFKSLAGLGTFRRLFALGFRTVVRQALEAQLPVWNRIRWQRPCLRL